MTIGELVRLTAVRYSTLKFYTQQGMLPFEQAEDKSDQTAESPELRKNCANIGRLKRTEEDNSGD